MCTFLKFLTRKKKLTMCEIISVVFTVWTGKKLMKEETKP